MKLIILFIVAQVTLTSVGNKYHLLAESTSKLTQTTYWFDQLLDHTNPRATTTWKQRYHLINDYFDPTNGAVVLYICGEWTCDGIGTGTLAYKIAQQQNAAILVLEHRFYGESQPFAGPDALNIQYMERYLTVGQALDDIAYFITIVKRLQLHGIKPYFPWVHMGGSYPGALASWFRYKYPHLTVAGIGSSGVVNPILDFGQFDQQIYDSALLSGQWCVDQILSVVNEAVKQLSNPDTRLPFLQTFNSQELNDGEFYFYLVDTIVMQIQYGRRVEFCNSLKDLSTSEALDVVRLLSKQYDVEDYGSIYLSDPHFDRNRNSRQWYFQTCQEVGWMQTPSQINPMRPNALNLDFWKKWCQDSYGIGMSLKPIWPDVEKTNLYYGGTNLNVKNLIMTNGSEDPWKQASVYNPRDGYITIIHIVADNMAHCVDFKASKDTDPQVLTDARTLILNNIDTWIKEWKSIQ